MFSIYLRLSYSSQVQERGGTMYCPSCGSELPAGTTVCPRCTPDAAPPRPLPTAGDFGALFSRATSLWKDNLGDLVILTLVFLLVGWIPVANVGFFTGYTRGLIKVARGGKARVGDIFHAWDCFGDLLGYVLLAAVAFFVLAHLPILGPVATFALCLVITPGVYGVIDRRMKLVDAFRWSFAAVQADPVNWLLAVLVGGVLGSVGGLALFVGLIVTLSWGYLIIILQYESARSS
jgi:hypothetical protein